MTIPTNQKPHQPLTYHETTYLREISLARQLLAQHPTSCHILPDGQNGIIGFVGVHLSTHQGHYPHDPNNTPCQTDFYLMTHGFGTTVKYEVLAPAGATLTRLQEEANEIELATMNQREQQ